MKVWLGSVVVAPWLAVAFAPRPTPTTVVIGGEFNGYLSPCGCSAPMLGGVARLGGLVAATRQAGKTLVLLNGPITNSLGRQSELKAETVSEAVRTMASSGFGLSAQDARLGVGTVSAMQSLSGNKLLYGRRGRVAGAFWITAASQKQAEMDAYLDERAGSLDEAMAQSEGRPTIVLLEGDLSHAQRIAARYPSVRLVIYSSRGKAPGTPQKWGSTWLVHPGERGTSALRLVWQDGKWISYHVVPLGPDTPSDTKVNQVFHTYLNRVDREDLLEQMPRSDGPNYAGTKLCMSCHAKAASIWQTSKHAGALNTLEHEGHDKDPDCISCHVVGIDNQKGFRSRALTTDLADVGCESCHGPGAEHAAVPSMHKMAKVGSESCMKCHTASNSPRFSYEAYWKKIAHE